MLYAVETTIVNRWSRWDLEWRPRLGMCRTPWNSLDWRLLEECWQWLDGENLLSRFLVKASNNVGVYVCFDIMFWYPQIKTNYLDSNYTIGSIQWTKTYLYIFFDCINIMTQKYLELVQTAVFMLINAWVYRDRTSEILRSRRVYKPLWLINSHRLRKVCFLSAQNSLKLFQQVSTGDSYYPAPCAPSIISTSALTVISFPQRRR
jgi:hypothetical protein